MLWKDTVSLSRFLLELLADFIVKLIAFVFIHLSKLNNSWAGREA